MQSALEVFEVVGTMNFYGDEMIKSFRLAIRKFLHPLNLRVCVVIKFVLAVCYEPN